MTLNLFIYSYFSGTSTTVWFQQVRFCQYNLSGSFPPKLYHLVVLFYVVLVTAPSLTKLWHHFLWTSCLDWSEPFFFALFLVARAFADHPRWPVFANVFGAIPDQSIPNACGVGWANNVQVTHRFDATPEECIHEIPTWIGSQVIPLPLGLPWMGSWILSSKQLHFFWHKVSPSCKLNCL